MSVHTIRLHGPWQYQLPPYSDAETSSGAPSGRIDIPCDWTEQAPEGRYDEVQFERRFGCPTNTIGQRIDLVFERVSSPARIHLNGHLMCDIAAGQSDIRIDVSERLRPRNQLVVAVQLTASTDAKPQGILGEVRLEIHE